jgi:hypothetical protein
MVSHELPIRPIARRCVAQEGCGAISEPYILHSSDAPVAEALVTLSFLPAEFRRWRYGRIQQPQHLQTLATKLIDQPIDLAAYLDTLKFPEIAPRRFRHLFAA